MHLAGPDAPLALGHSGGTLNASFFAVREGAPPHWRPCFTVESTESAVERVRELGGKQLLEPLEIPDGTIAMVLDPQGALFTLFAEEVDP